MYKKLGKLLDNVNSNNNNNNSNYNKSNNNNNNCFKILLIYLLSEIIETSDTH